jgi:hypothetical protein
MATKKTIPATKKLNKIELNHVVPCICRLLKTAKGQKKAVKNYWIKKYIYDQIGVVINPGHIRTYLHYIRTKGLVKCVVANSNGYYIAASTLDATKYLTTLQTRIKEIGRLKSAIKSQVATVLGKQQKTKKVTRKRKK